MRKDSVKKKVILVTNDDGVWAEGIKELAQVAQKFGEVYVVAPDCERSAASHSITISRPLCCKKLNTQSFCDKVFSVDGTPVDCVRLAFRNILPQKPDLILSGINRGANLGEDVLYSGTIAAALEGSKQGCLSFAFSNCVKEKLARYDTCAKVVDKVLEGVSSYYPFGPTTININVPFLDYNELQGFRVASLGNWTDRKSYKEFRDQNGETFYSLPGLREKYLHCPDADCHLVKEGYVTVSVLGSNLLDNQINSQITSILPQL